MQVLESGIDWKLMEHSEFWRIAISLYGEDRHVRTDDLPRVEPLRRPRKRISAAGG
ncbi:hypothetical protein GALLR39Z86_36830 [Glycomyces algeriensis]|uniref:Uncharacterized protein n=1 Tax=Glycomyces algeriensis TaxID=256037 RepID=A0A9W6GBP4_9ACTN|nr:hypothetical protein GALLR39Z86_36830 [Glycomyces algeriensis]